MRVSSVVLICLLAFSPAAMAAQMLIVPPLVPYLSGCEPAHPEYDEIVVNDLGRTLYYILSDAIADYNGGQDAVRSQVFFQSVPLASPSCAQNEKIRKFYTSVRNEADFLESISDKYDLDMIVWLDFSSGDVLACRDEIRHCPVASWLKVFDRNEMRRFDFTLQFSVKQKSFQPDSLEPVAEKMHEQMKAFIAADIRETPVQ